MTDDEKAQIAQLMDARNAAQREFYKTRSLEAKSAFRAAAAEHDRLRAKLDPEFKKARSEAARRWREKKKLGIPTGPKS